MASGRTTRVLAFATAALICVAVGVWLAPRVRTGGAGSQAGISSPDPYRPEPGTALLEVLPPSLSGGNVDAAWQRAIQTHAARVADPSLVASVVSDRGAVAKTRWGAKKGTAGYAGAVAAVKRGLTVRLVPGTALIAVSVDVEPKEDAVALTNTLCQAYLERCRQLLQQDGRERMDLLKARAMELEKQRERRLAIAHDLGRQFGGDPKVSGEQVSAAAARLGRLQEALAAARARPTTAPEDARPAKELEELVKRATDELAKTAEAAAQFKECHDSALELGERLRRLRDDIQLADQADAKAETGVRIVVEATAGP